MKMTSWVDPVAVLASVVFLGYSGYSVAGCGGGSYGGSPSAPSSGGSSSSGSGSVTVTITSSAGNGAFTPNPIQAAAGTTVIWKNNTGDTHNLVMDDGAVIGTLAPGASSAPMQSRSGNYHCTNHPSMVGSINGTVAPTPPPGSGDGY